MRATGRSRVRPSTIALAPERAAWSSSASTMLLPCTTTASPPSRRASANARSISSCRASSTSPACTVTTVHGASRRSARRRATRTRYSDCAASVDGHHHATPQRHARQTTRRLRLAQVAVDAIGGGLHRQLAQRGQVARREERLQRLRGLFGHVHLALLQPFDQLPRRQVDQHDVAQPVEHDVGHGFTDAHAGDPVDHVVQALQMLDVDRRVDVDAGIEQLDHVLPTTLVAAAGHVAVRQFVDQRQLRPAREQRIQVQFVQRARRAVGRRVVDAPARQHVQSFQQRGRLAAGRGSRRCRPPRPVPRRCSSRARASMAYVLPTPGAAPRKMVSRPAPSRCSSPINASACCWRTASLRESLMRALCPCRRTAAWRQRASCDACASSARLSSSTLTRGAPSTPKLAGSVCAATSAVDLGPGQSACRAPLAPPAPARRDGERCGSSPLPDCVTSSAGTCSGAMPSRRAIRAVEFVDAPAKVRIAARQVAAGRPPSDRSWRRTGVAGSSAHRRTAAPPATNRAALRRPSTRLPLAWRGKATRPSVGARQRVQEAEARQDHHGEHQVRAQRGVVFQAGHVRVPGRLRNWSQGSHVRAPRQRGRGRSA